MPKPIDIPSVDAPMSVLRETLLRAKMRIFWLEQHRERARERALAEQRKLGTAPACPIVSFEERRNASDRS